MRASLPLLALLLQTVSALPLPISALCNGQDCIHGKPATPPTYLPTPQFPDHQTPLSEKPFNNAPVAPPKSLSPSKALSSTKPLTSAYLMSLTWHATPSSTNDDLPSAPTSALESLRKEDSERYWAEVGEDAELSERPISTMAKCAEAMGLRSSSAGHPSFNVRQYDDIMVVGIVVIFLFAVMITELVQKSDDVPENSYVARISY